jgi:hypothetical protein
MKLTENDIKILKTFSMYLQSFGSKVGKLRIDVQTEGDVYWDYTYWQGDGTRMTIDSYDLIDDLIKKIFDENEDTMLENFSYDDRGEIMAIVNSNDNTLTFKADVYTMNVDTHSTEYLFDDIDNEDIKEWLSNKEGVYTFGNIHYEGSGDSGYIESDITLDNNSREDYPRQLEDWMYRTLEQYGGWEINEGSQGDFHFNFDKRTIHLEHNENYEDSRTYELPLKFNF